MSKVNLVTKNIWPLLTRAVKENQAKSIVAVAYFGQNGASMLPLSKGSILLVDASIKALKNGQTCPDELLKLYYKGVHIYSLENLHSKLFIIGNTLYCGSANVSAHSANRLHETLLKTTDKSAIADAKIFIRSLCRIELGDAEISEMSKYYIAPKNFISERKGNKENFEFHICNLRFIEYTEKEEEQAKKGRAAAARQRIKKSRHRVDEFIWEREMKFKIGDSILQILKKDGDKSYASPVGKLIHFKKWSNGNKTKYFCFVEVPDYRSKNLSVVRKRLNEWDAKAIARSGKKHLALEAKIKSLWKK